MEPVLQKNRSFVFLMILFFLVSCNDKVEYTKYKSVPNALWAAGENISFEFDVKDTILPKDLFINIRNNKEYPFSNLYVITELNFPNGNKIVDTLQYQMADKSGNFLGKGFTDIKENKLFYKEEKLFPQSGKYIFNIHHAMRKNGEVNAISLLKGVQDVGFSIEKTK